MLYYNKVILAGNLGKNPELKTSKNGVVYATVSLATSKRKKISGSSSEWTDETTWHNLKIYDNKDVKKATNFSKHLSKGDNIQIEGSISVREYDNSGQAVKMTEIIVDNYFIVAKKDPLKELTYDPIPNYIPQKPAKMDKIIDDEIPF